MSVEVECRNEVVYLIQKVGSLPNLYKIGRSSTGIGRVKSYGKGTRWLCVMECEDAPRAERVLKDALSVRYENYENSKETFVCDDELEIRVLFTNVILQYIQEFPRVVPPKISEEVKHNKYDGYDKYAEGKRSDESKSVGDRDESKSVGDLVQFMENLRVGEQSPKNEVVPAVKPGVRPIIKGKRKAMSEKSTLDRADVKLRKVFPDYLGDMSFGGLKQLVRVNVTQSYVSIAYIKDRQLVEFKQVFSGGKSPKSCLKEYYGKLFGENVIVNKNIIDLNDTALQMSIMRVQYRIKAAVPPDDLPLIYQGLLNMSCPVLCLISKYLLNNAVINGDISCCYYPSKNGSRCAVVDGFGSYTII